MVIVTQALALRSAVFALNARINLCFLKGIRLCEDFNSEQIGQMLVKQLRQL